MTSIPENPNARLTRDALAKALTAVGHPIKPATLTTKGTRGGGPLPAFRRPASLVVCRSFVGGEPATTKEWRM